jgi:hypothetical protein
MGYGKDGKLASAFSGVWKHASMMMHEAGSGRGTQTRIDSHPGSRKRFYAFQIGTGWLA